MGEQEKDRWHSEPVGSDPSGPDRQAGVLNAVRDALGQLRYGAIQLTVHDGKVVQLDITEKRRFSS